MQMQLRSFFHLEIMGPLTTTLLCPMCLQPASLLHRASCQLSPHPRSQHTFQDRGRSEVKEGAQAAKGHGDLPSSAAPDLRLGLPRPCGRRQLQRIRVRCAEGPLGTKGCQDCRSACQDVRIKIQVQVHLASAGRGCFSR